MLVQAQKTIERLTEDNTRMESELLAKGRLEEEMTATKEELDSSLKQLICPYQHRTQTKFPQELA